MLHVVKTYIKNKIYRKRNSHNYTQNFASGTWERVTVGNETYGEINAFMAAEEGGLHIGNYCSIAEGVQFMVSMEHPLNFLSTYPFRTIYWGDGRNYDALSKGDIIVEDDVWIGKNAVILSDVTIHQGAVIATGAVVTKDVPAYAVAGGVPAKVIKYRFQEEVINELLKIDYGRLTKELVEKHMDELYMEIRTAEQVRKMDWMPRK